MVRILLPLVLTLILGGILFLLIKKFASPNKPAEDFEDMEGTLQDIAHTLPDLKIRGTIKEPYNIKMQDILGSIKKIITFLNKTIMYFFKTIVKQVQELIRQLISRFPRTSDSEDTNQDFLESDESPSRSHRYEEVDTSFLENTQPKSEEIQPYEQLKKEPFIDKKADTFVQNLLDDSSKSDESKVSHKDMISESFYYKYTEKRYIQKIINNPRDVESYKKLGDLYIEMGNYNDAGESFKQVLRLKHNDKTSLMRLEYIRKLMDKK